MYVPEAWTSLRLSSNARRDTKTPRGCAGVIPPSYMGVTALGMWFGTGALSRRRQHRISDSLHSLSHGHRRLSCIVACMSSYDSTNGVITVAAGFPYARSS
ncbi:hypothetical protein OH77DRAFT_822632 [Trametes cingulata]|nr:hypothetical protein OH77DRAFT_822632 [Trametes cingulata]